MVEIQREDLDTLDHNSNIANDDLIDLVEEGLDSPGPDDGDGLGISKISP